MDRKESSNVMQLIKFGAIRLRGNFCALFMGAFAMCMPLILAVGVPAILAMLFNELWIFTIGLLLFIIGVGPLQVGYIKFFNATIEGKQPKISMVYSQFKFNVKTLKYIYYAGLLFIMYVVGGVLWLVPAGFAISFYSMVLFFEERFEYARFSDAFRDCSRKMLGNRLAMFSYKLTFYFVYFLLFCVAGLGLGLIYTLSLESLAVAYISAICIMIIFIFLYTLITVYFHSCNQIFFEDTLMYNERKTEQRRKELEEKKRKKELEAQMTAVHVSAKVENEPKDLGKAEEVKCDENTVENKEASGSKGKAVVSKSEVSVTPKAKSISTSKSTKTKTAKKSTTVTKNATTKKTSTTKKSAKTTK